MSQSPHQHPPPRPVVGGSPAAAASPAKPPERVTLEQTCMAAAACRQELTRLAQLIERNAAATSSPSSSTSGGGESHHHHHSFMDSLTSFVSSDKDKEKARDLEKEHLALARSCQQAAKVSEYEAVALQDSLKLIQALKTAAEHERDSLEDKLDNHKRIIESLQQTSFNAAIKEAQQQHEHEHGHAANDGKSRTTIIRVDACVGTEGSDGNDDESDDSKKQKSSSPLDSECLECVTLRTRLSEITASSQRQQEVLREELASKTRLLNDMTNIWKGKLSAAVAAERARGDAMVRRSAASFLQRSCTSEAVSARKLLESELGAMRHRMDLRQAAEDYDGLKTQSASLQETTMGRLARSESDNHELRRVLHKISVRGDSTASASTMPRTGSSDTWTSKDDAVVGQQDAKGAFHAWLHASGASSGQSTPRPTISVDHALHHYSTPDRSEHQHKNKKDEDDDENNKGSSSSSSSSSSGIIEAARRLLSSKLATSGQVSIEDETVARALHHTNEQMKDLLEENMRLQLRLREIELLQHKK